MFRIALLLLTVAVTALSAEEKDRVHDINQPNMSDIAKYAFNVTRGRGPQRIPADVKERSNSHDPQQLFERSEGSSLPRMLHIGYGASGENIWLRAMARQGLERPSLEIVIADGRANPERLAHLRNAYGIKILRENDYVKDWMAMSHYLWWRAEGLAGLVSEFLSKPLETYSPGPRWSGHRTPTITAYFFSTDKSATILSRLADANNPYGPIINKIHLEDFRKYDYETTLGVLERLVVERPGACEAAAL